MLVVLTSLAAILFAILVNIFVVPNVLRLTTAAGHALLVRSSHETSSSALAFPAFLAMLSILAAWAVACFLAADWLAGEEFGNRWVLLLIAVGLAVAPDVLYRRMAVGGRIAQRLAEPLHSAFDYAGGIQSLAVLATMVSGFFFDWWENLPG